MMDEGGAACGVGTLLGYAGAGRRDVRRCRSEEKLDESKSLDVNPTVQGGATG
jgi:hypothetical protein